MRDVVYAGNMGLATGLGVVLDAATLLRDNLTIRFVLIGGGAEAVKLRDRAAIHGLTNVVSPALLRAQASRAVADDALTVIPLAPTLVDSIPSKIFDAMAVGSPAVVSAAGEAQRLVERADTGIAVPAGDPQALAAGIRRVLSDEALRARFRAHGPPFVRAHCDRAANMRALVARIEALVGTDGTALVSMKSSPAAGAARRRLHSCSLGRHFSRMPPTAMRTVGLSS